MSHSKRPTSSGARSALPPEARLRGQRKVSATAALVGSAAALAGAGITAWVLPGSMPSAAAHPGQEEVQSTATLTAFTPPAAPTGGLTQTSGGTLAPASTLFQGPFGQLVHGTGGTNTFGFGGAVGIDLPQVFQALSGDGTSASAASATANPLAAFPGVFGFLDVGVPTGSKGQSGGDLPLFFGGQSSGAASGTSQSTSVSAAQFGLQPNFIDPLPNLTLQTVDPALFQNLSAIAAQAQPLSPADAQALNSAVTQSLGFINATRTFIPDQVNYPDGSSATFPSGTTSTQFVPVGSTIAGTTYDTPGNFTGPGGTPIIVRPATDANGTADKASDATDGMPGAAAAQVAAATPTTVTDGVPDGGGDASAQPQQQAVQQPQPQAVASANDGAASASAASDSAASASAASDGQGSVSAPPPSNPAPPAGSQVAFDPTIPSYDTPGTFSLG